VDIELNIAVNNVTLQADDAIRLDQTFQAAFNISFLIASNKELQTLDVPLG
jgi:hypothetical protein